MPHVIPSPTIPQPHKSPGSINFPKLSASPTHLPKLNIPAGGTTPGRQDLGAVAAPAVPPPRGPPKLTSPTEKNDLNMPGSQYSSREQLASSRAGSRDRLDGHGAPRVSGQILNNSRPDRGYTDRERDNRYRENRLEQQHDNLGRAAARQAGPPVMPNGYKPGQPLRGERTIDSRTGPARPQQQTPQQPHNSDSDDEDWC